MQSFIKKEGDMNKRNGIAILYTDLAPRRTDRTQLPSHAQALAQDYLASAQTEEAALIAALDKLDGSLQEERKPAQAGVIATYKDRLERAVSGLKAISEGERRVSGDVAEAVAFAPLLEAIDRYTANTAPDIEILTQPIRDKLKATGLRETFAGVEVESMAPAM